MWFADFLHRFYAHALGYWPCHGVVCSWDSVKPLDDVAHHSVLGCHIIGDHEEGGSSLENLVKPFRVLIGIIVGDFIIFELCFSVFRAVMPKLVNIVNFFFFGN